jgi:hypothetical protein
MHRVVLVPTSRPTGEHEHGPFKQTRNGPLTSTKRPKIISRDGSARSRTCPVLVHMTGLRREGKAHLAISVRFMSCAQKP